MARSNLILPVTTAGAGVKTNLLFFTKDATPDDGSDHFHTDTIWFYEHPYPPGYKSYSKTKPIQLDEFKPIRDWWGSEADNFAKREAYDADPEITEKKAWKYDFAKAREQAVAAAQPHWDEADRLGNQATNTRRQARYLADSLTARRNDSNLVALLQEQLADLESELEDLAKDQRPYTLVLMGELRSAIAEGSPQGAIQSLDNAVQRLRSEADTLDQRSRDAKAAGDRLYWPIYNLDQKNKYAPEEESHDPDVLLEKYKILLGQIEETENQLKSELAAALAHHFTAEAAEE